MTSGLLSQFWLIYQFITSITNLHAPIKNKGSVVLLIWLMEREDQWKKYQPENKSIHFKSYSGLIKRKMSWILTYKTWLILKLSFASDSICTERRDNGEEKVEDVIVPFTVIHNYIT